MNNEVQKTGDKALALQRGINELAKTQRDAELILSHQLKGETALIEKTMETTARLQSLCRIMAYDANFDLLPADDIANLLAMIENGLEQIQKNLEAA